MGIGNTQYNSLYALGQAAREHCHAELVSASHLVRLLDTILSRSGAQASLEVTERSVFPISSFVFHSTLDDFKFVKPTAVKSLYRLHVLSVNFFEFCPQAST